MKKFYNKHREALNGVGIIILLVVVFGGIFFLSENTGDRSLDKQEVEQQEPVEANQLLEEGQTIDEEKMKELTVIDYEEFQKHLKNKKTTTVVMLGYDDCYWCGQQKPILQMLMYEKNLDVKYLKTTSLSKDQLTEIESLNEELQGFGTPTLIAVKNKKVTVMSSGAMNRTQLIQAFKKVGLIKEEK